MSEIRVNNLSNESSTGGPTISGITTFSGTNFFVPPVGSTAQRPQDPQKGAIRFNTDTAHLEYYRGDTIGWSEIEASNVELDGGHRGLFGGGTPGINTIEYITISTLGNGTDFGDRTINKSELASCSSNTRGIFWGGTKDPEGVTNIIDFVTIASTGDAQDFGDLPNNKKEIAACSNEIRGLCAGGGAGDANAIHYITIASTGNSKDFGDLSFANNNITCTQNSTRGLFQNRNEPSGNNHIDYVTIASMGNGEDFGDSTDARYGGASMVCSSTRGIFGGGYAPGITNLIDYVTTATLGNAIDFGDLTAAGYMCCGCSSPTRGVFGARGVHPAGVVNTMDYIQIATTGNAADFGDSATTSGKQAAAGCSNGHGGL